MPQSSLQSFGNISLKISEAAGPVITAEWFIRGLFEKSEPLRAELKINEDYCNCKLSYLVKAIRSYFSEKLEPFKLKKLTDFVRLRNSLVHGNICDLMKCLGLEPKGQQIVGPRERQRIMEEEKGIKEKDKTKFSKCGERVLFTNSKISEGILMISNRGGFGMVRQRAEAVVSILMRLSRII